MRDTSSRRERIVNMLKERGSVQVLELADLFKVSTVTIRKDLKFLEKQGIATRSYGGAIVNDLNVPTLERPIELKQQLHAEEKSGIGKVAAGLIEAGDSIILDSGTTTLQIATQLAEREDLTVVTNGINIMNELAHCDNINVLMLGGTLRRKNMSLSGIHAEHALKDLHVDKVFLGVDGFHMERGITTHFEAEAMLNRQMCKAAVEIIVVTDSSKFGNICLYKIIEPAEVSKVITDSGIPDEYREGLIQLGVEVIIA